MSESHELSRRGFLETTAAAGLAAPLVVSASTLGMGGTPGANERIGVGLIGCGGMGRANLGACAGHTNPPIVQVAK